MSTVPPAPGATEAAVIVPVYRDGAGALRLVVLRRAEGGVHGGQLAFPGGRREPEDDSMRATALRETAEEIGLAPERVEVVAELPVARTGSTGYVIHPFLARVVPPPAWVRQEREVAEVFDVRVDALARPDAQGESTEHFPWWPRPRTIAWYRVGPHRLWGVSYRIFSPLLPRLLAGEWDI